MAERNGERHEGTGLIELKLQPREADLGEFSVRRALPSKRHPAVGPFVFFDHMGPAQFPPGKGIAVRPHPHIGLATITYLFCGEIVHRDSLGVVQKIHPGAVNLMTSGRGIVHSERAGDDLDQTSELHGIQSWIALPKDREECEPAFTHYPEQDIPTVDVNGVSVTVIMGSAFGYHSPVQTYSPTLYLDASLPAGAILDLPNAYDELAVYVVSGEVTLDGECCELGTMAVLKPGAITEQSLPLRADASSRVMIIGGGSLGKRYVEWNFVHSSAARIQQARSEWQADRFERVPGDDEFIPLPD